MAQPVHYLASVRLLLMLAILLSVLGLLVWLRRRRSRGPAEPSCGKCGYNVRGLPSFICPECGSDLREVGIIAAREVRHPLSLAAKLPLLIPFLLVLTLIGSPVLVRLAPRPYNGALIVTLANPASRAYSSLEVIAVYKDRGDLVNPQSIRLHLVMRGGEAWSGERPTSPDVALQWMRQVLGPAGDEQPLEPEAAHAASIVGQLATSRANHTYSSGPFGSLLVHNTLRVGLAGWVLPAMGGFWAVVWSLALWQTVRRHRRMLATAAPGAARISTGAAAKG